MRSGGLASGCGNAMGGVGILHGCVAESCWFTHYSRLLGEHENADPLRVSRKAVRFDLSFRLHGAPLEDVVAWFQLVETE
jgi:hypothetical protein